jgi:hypothetical protein
MKAELDRLRLAVDEATAQVIAAECDLETARGVEREAVASRVLAENVHDVAVTRLLDARAALDVRLGIGAVRELPARGPLLPPILPVVADYDDDDDPVR